MYFIILIVLFMFFELVFVWSTQKYNTLKLQNTVNVRKMVRTLLRKPREKSYC